MRRRWVVAASVALVVLAGCGGPAAVEEFDELCVSEVTGERVPDDWCEDDDEHPHHPGHAPVFVPHGSAGPVGSKVAGASSVKPVSGTVTRPRSTGTGGTSGGRRRR